MKNIFGLLLISIILSSCNQAELDQLNAKNDSLDVINKAHENSLAEILSSFNEIQGNLNEIKKRENILENNTLDVERSSSITEQINSDIAVISELMLANENLIKELNQKIKGSAVKLAEFQKMVDNLNAQLATKNIEISRLNEELKRTHGEVVSLYFSIDSLKMENHYMAKTVKEKDDEINEGYFAYGTFKELKEKNVLSKEGGFLGLGKSEKLNNDFNKEYFSKVDIRKQKSFLIYAKKAELITTHPASSYEFKASDKMIDSLVILNPSEFWAASKYMVIVIN